MRKLSSCALILTMALTGCFEGGQNGLEMAPSAQKAPVSTLPSYHEPLLMHEAKEATIEVGDLDLDGDLDIVVTDDLFPGMRIWQNIENSEYIHMPVIGLESSPFLGWDTTTFSLGDLDGDGDLDIVQGRLMESRVWFNQGGLQFVDSGQSLAASSYLGTFPTRAIEIADMDGDGDLDIVNGAMCQVWFNNGYGKFKNSTQFLGIAPATQIKAGDLDGDGDLDLVVVNPGKGVFAYKNNGKGLFDVAKAEVIGVPDPDAIDLVDIDRDGDLDLAGRSTNVPIWYLKNENNSLATFGPMNPTLPVTKTGFGVSIVDFNQDGKMDLLHTRSDRSVFKGDGRGHYRAVKEMPSFQGPLVKVADIDGDGDMDFISEKIWFQQ